MEPSIRLFRLPLSARMLAAAAGARPWALGRRCVSSTAASPVADFVDALEGAERRVPEWYNPEFVKLHEKVVQYLPNASLEGELLPLMKAVSAMHGFGLSELVSAIETRLISLLEGLHAPSLDRAT
ncbi:Lysine-specific histone demethylase 1B [Perkinsus olseni]|uniref:Lysine-specific histone demethylase 1B n=2 Tax=Perkinsus olseni TaxID=32597 RepID=A0A7J6MAF0_PEROL|nr:Lysine-specific histone demethylase 1B [Perkinsus olseni]